MEDLNLYFTGDIHAIGAANNLLAALMDASILHGNPHRIDALRVGWKRALDMNDRALRSVTIGQGGRANGYPRETGFDITAASEVMAILAVARDLHDLREATRPDHGRALIRRRPAVTADDLGAAGAMTVLLKDAIKPNLIQTLEGQPCLMHARPFANIAHGNSSLVADLIGLSSPTTWSPSPASARTWGWRSSSTSSAGSAACAQRGGFGLDRARAQAPRGLDDDTRGDRQQSRQAIETGAANLSATSGSSPARAPCVDAVNHRRRHRRGGRAGQAPGARRRRLRRRGQRRFASGGEGRRSRPRRRRGLRAAVAVQLRV